MENEINLNESEDIVFDRNEEKQLDFDRIKLKTLKVTDGNADDEDISSTTSNDNEETKKKDEELKTNILKRATSITNKLTDTFSRFTAGASTSIPINYSDNLIHFDQCQVPYELFKKVFLSFGILNNTLKNGFSPRIF